MAEPLSSPEVETSTVQQELIRSAAVEIAYLAGDDITTPDVHGAGMKIERARDAYKVYAGFEEKPNKVEILSWYFYELCSHFIHLVLIPIVFPLIITQIGDAARDSGSGVGLARKYKGVAACTHKETILYLRLTNRSLLSKYSPLEWTSISWGIGLALAAPLLHFVSIILDHGYKQTLVAGAAAAIGSIFCLPAGFFRNIWLFPPYIATIVCANVIATACHTRHLGLLVRGFTGPTIRKSQFQARRAVSAWLSLYAAAAGSLGSAVFSSFTYHMLREDEELLGLWIVSIFSGIIWLTGIFHFFVTNRPCVNPPISKSHALSVFKFPHAVGGLMGTFLSSFTSMCIFSGGVLYLVGQLCYDPKALLYFFLTYFIFPLISLPMLQPLQHLIKADAIKMQLMGFFLSALTSGSGFYFRNSLWGHRHVLFFGAVQSTSAGLLHAFGRVLLMDCSPPGKEGAFSTWHSWIKALGTCAGFALATAVPGNLFTSFGLSFLTTVCGVVILIFGNVSDYGGAKAAGHVRHDSERGGSPVSGLEAAYETQEPAAVH
ncbi:hypothetical protein ACFX2I_022918 [Malus domestica]|nr:uncharacterized protein LOC114822871 [Malus domestica]